MPQGIEVRLRVTSCEVDGQIKDASAREFTMVYRLENDSQGFRLSRQSIVFPSDLPAEKRAIWNKTFDLFFGKTLRPAPKFRNSSFSAFLRLDYLNLSEGWLVIGAARTLPADAASTQSPEEVLR